MATTDPIRIVVACGGTGGHIFPGLATARVLKARGHDVSLWLAGRDVEGASVDGWDGDVLTVRAAGFSSNVSARWLGAAASLVKAVGLCRREMKARRPSVVLAMGSYASVGPVLAARSLGIPVVLHEANAVPGRAISFLARFATVVAITFEGARPYLPAGKVVLTGLPIRTEPAGGFEEGLLKEGMFTLLVMGGSQGAHRLNELAGAAVCRLHAAGVPLQVVHLCGTRDESLVKARYAEAGVCAVVFGFLKGMRKAYEAADLCISRSGAASCMELSRYGVPALLIPLPSARRDHQARNAEALVAAGGAEMRREEGLTAEGLADVISSLVNDRTKLDRMRASVKNVAISDAAEKLADLVAARGGQVLSQGD